MTDQQQQHQQPAARATSPSDPAWWEPFFAQARAANPDATEADISRWAYRTLYLPMRQAFSDVMRGRPDPR